jgi:lysophospholipase L1-like esterase
MDKIWFYVWRKNGTNYDVVGKEEIKAKLSTGIQTITLTTPIEVLEGDYTGAMYKAVSANINVVLGSSHANGCIAQYTTTPTETNYNWDGIGGQQVAQHIFTYAQAPLIVGIGDSIMESYPLHSSYVDPNFTYDDLTKSWLYKLAQKDTRLVVQNCGQGGKTTTQIKAYFDEYVIAAKPKICILNGGINDIDGGATTKAQFLANITEMLDKCITNSIVPVVFSIGPWTLATTLKMQTRDAWNIDFKALVLSYPKAKFIEWDNLLGQFRTGGDAGNKWDVIPAYNSGGCHYNEAGNVVIADEVYRVLTH